MNILKSKIYIMPLYIWLVIFLFLLRILFFAASFGGIEHDSGWYLGVAKNLAERGIYASYTNTILEEEPGSHPSIHGRFSVQDKNGFSYFPAGVTVGPGYIVPEAIFLKIFGHGWWQYRLWPLFGFTGLLIVLFYTVWRVGGFLAFLFFTTWLWSVPQLTTAYAYEAYAEDIALFFLFASFIFYVNSIGKNKLKFMFFSGIFFSFSLLTKTLFLLPGLSFLLPCVFEAWSMRRHLKTFVFRWGLFLLGVVLPLILFEVYKDVYLITHFGYSGLHSVQEDMRLHFQSNGSGIIDLSLSHLDWDFIAKKTIIWLDVGITNSTLVFGFLFLSPVVLYNRIQKKHRILLVLLYAAMWISFAWFLLLSSTGWARHAWQAIVIGMLLISITFSSLLKLFLINIKIGVISILLVVIVLQSIMHAESFTSNFFLTNTTIGTWRMYRYVRGLEGLPSTPILSLEDQKGLVSYFKQHIKNEDRIYYAGWFLNAEASPLVDKVFYTLDRYLAVDQSKKTLRKAYLILGPYQQGEWSFMPQGYVQRKVFQLCERVVYNNPSYTLCLLQKKLVTTNGAYE